VTTVEFTLDSGVPIAIHDLGGMGDPAIFVHANGFHARVFGPLAAELDPCLACFGPDLRGHGLSGAPEDLNFSWADIACDVLAATRAVHEIVSRRNTESLPPAPTRPIGIGHSLGATALLLAEEMQPGTFKALYCYEPILIPDDAPAANGTRTPLSEIARRRRDEFASTGDAFERYRSRPPFAALDTRVLEAYVEYGFAPTDHGTVRLRCRPENEARIFEAAYSAHALDHLDSVQCPVTIAIGETSTDIGRTLAISALGRLSSARLVELPDLGHFGPLEAPAAVGVSILESLAPTA
jgi:pimeloyl-ACP methyl ester carboxylesterase